MSINDARLQELFDEIDLNHDGELDNNELVLALHKVGCPVCAESFAVSKFSGVPGKTTIVFKEFCEIIQTRELNKIYNALDLDHNEQLELRELEEALSQYTGFKFSPDEVKKMFELIQKKSLNQNPDFLSRSDFIAAMRLFPADTKLEFIKLWANTSASAYMLHTDAPHVTPSHLVLLAGFLAGAVSRTITAPFDRLSLVLRAGGTVHAGKGLFGTFQSLVQVGGVNSLWRGNGVNIIQVGPESAIAFFVYDWLKRYFLKDPTAPSPLEKFACGAAAGALAMTLVYPMYVFQARMAVADPGIYSGIFDCVRKTIKVEGYTSLFKGYTPSLIRIIPYKGFDMLIFQQLKEIFVPQGKDITVVQSMLFGGLASGFSQTLTYPLVCARTKLQAQGAAQGRPMVYKGTWDALRKTYFGNAALKLPAEGFRGIYNGCGANLMKMVPAVALQFTVYEKSLKYLKWYTDSQ